ILLDLGLPDGSGLDFISAIRDCTDAPLLIVSGQKQPEKRINGFELGADDFIPKPIDFPEMLARIKAHLRRYRASHTNQNIKKAAAKTMERIRFDNWVMD